jgi:hypothetical protein
MEENTLIEIFTIYKIQKVTLHVEVLQEKLEEFIETKGWKLMETSNGSGM